MGQLFLKDRYGLTQGFEIAGEQPTPEEATWIKSVLDGTPSSPAPSKPTDDTGIGSAFLGGVGSGFNQMQAGIAGLGAYLARNNGTGEVMGYKPEELDAIRQQNKKEAEGYYAPQGSFADQQGAYDTTRYLAYQLGQSAPATIGGMVGAALGTAVAPGPGTVSGFMLGAGGAGLASIPQSFEENLSTQEEQFGKVKDEGKAFGSALVQSALEGVADRATLGAAKIIGGAVPSIAKSLVRDATKSAIGTAAKTVGSAAVMGFSTEAVTEAVQQAITRWQAEKPLGDEQAQKEYLESAIVGGLLGGVTGGAFGTVGATLDFREQSKLAAIRKDLDAEDQVGNYVMENRKARRAQAEAAILAEEKTAAAMPNGPLLEDLRQSQDLLKGPKTVTRPVKGDATLAAEMPSPDTTQSVATRGAEGVGGDSSRPLFSEQEYADAVAAMRGEKLVSADKIKNTMKVGRTKATAIFNAMLDRTDARKSGLAGNYLTVVDNSTSGKVETETAEKPSQIKRTYEMKPVSKEDVAPYSVIIQGGRKVGPDFKTAEEAFNFADTQKLGDFSVTQSDTPKQFGVYEVTSGVEGVKPARRLVKAFATSEEALSHLNGLNPKLSPETNQINKVSDRSKQIAAKTRDMMKGYEAEAQRLVDQMLGPGRTVLELVEKINSPVGDDVVLEGEAMMADTLNRIRVASGVMNPNLSPDQFQDAINSVAHHEMVHIARGIGLFDQNQWKALVKRANTRVSGKNYTYLERAQVRTAGSPVPVDMTEQQRYDLLQEEAVAEMVRDYMRDPTKFDTDTRSMIRKLIDFLTTLGQYAKNVQAGNDVLSDFASGKIAEQTPSGKRVALYGTYYSTVKIPGFYLKSAEFFERAGEANPDKEYSGQHWLNMIRNPERIGIKKEELQWLALPGWLEGQKAVSAKEILQYIAANSIDVRERLAQQPTEAERVEHDGLMKVVARGYNESGERDFKAWVNSQIENVGPYYDAAKRFKELDAKIVPDANLYHEQTTQSGGEGYSELIFHMPHLSPEFSVDAHFNGFPNILAFGRFKTRTIEGKKTLFIEEMQSDLHQQGKKNGYVSKSDIDYLNQLKQEASRLIDEREAFADRLRAGSLTEPEMERYRKLLVDIAFTRATIAELQSKAYIPEAPFKTTWSDLVIRRLVRHAVDTGHEAISWNGEPVGVAMTEGYNRSGDDYEQKLEEKANEDGTNSYNVVVRDTYDNSVIDRKDVSGIVRFYTQRLAKDVAKLFNKSEFGNAVPRLAQRVEASNADLNLEEVFPTVDDFMMVMQELGNQQGSIDPEFGKRYRKAIQLARNSRNFDPQSIIEKAGLGSRWIDDFNEAFPEYAIEETPTATVDPYGNPNVARWVLDITPELKAAAQGNRFPLFSAVSKRKAPDTVAFRRWFAGSKVVGDDGEPLVVYHGTMRDFDQFRKGNPTGAVGSGYYFTNTADDASYNYADPEGPDQIARMQDATDRYLNENDVPPNFKLDENGIAPHIRKQFMDHGGAVVPVWLSIKKPVVMNGASSTRFTPEEIQSMIDHAYEIDGDYLNLDPEEIVKEFKSMLEVDRTNAEDMMKFLVDSRGLSSAMDMEGMLVGPEIVRGMWEAAGYDGVIMKNAKKRWPLFGYMTEDTSHYIAFRPEQIKSVNNTGTFNPEDARFMYSAVRPAYSATAAMGERVPDQSTPAAVARITSNMHYNNIAPVLEKLIYGAGKRLGMSQTKARSLAEGTVFNLQDVYQPLGKMIDRVRDNGGTISVEDDAYLQQQLMTGKIEAQILDAKRKVYNPLVEAVRSLGMKKSDVDEILKRHPSNIQYINGIPYERSAVRNILNNYDDPNLALSELYLYAQHAKERNALMRERNRNLTNERPEQFDSGSGMSDFEADDVLTWFGSKPFGNKFSSLADPKSIRSLYRKLISYTNDVRVKSGLTPDFRTMLDKSGNPVERYQDYAPLRGYTDANPDQVDELTQHFARTGKRLNIKGKEDKAALGRRSEASNLIAHAILQNEEAIIRGQKNEIGNAFLNMLRQNAAVSLRNGPNMANERLSDFAEVVPLTKVQPTYDAKSGVVRMSPASARFDPDMMIVKRGGEEVGIRIKDPRLRQALIGNTMLGDTGQKALINGLLKLNRFLAAVRTSYNPEFLISNFFRDFGAAQLNLSELEIKGLRADVMKSVLPAIHGSYKSMRGTGQGNMWASAFDDFVAHGGRTAYMGLRDLETTIQRTMDELSTDPEGNLEKVKGSISAVGRLIETQNEAVENGVRVATYKHLVDKLLAQSKTPTDPKEIERIKDVAAYTAKNLTVNFNQGGAQKPLMNALYLFYNASMQGTAALVNPLIRSKKVRRIWLATVAAGALQDIIMSAISGIGDDGEKKYDKIPDHILETNMIILNPASETGYIKIPMPYLFNAAWNAGRAISRGIRGGYTIGETMNTVMGTAVSSLNPWGSGGSFLNFVAPTVVDPLVDLTTNINFADAPIAPEKDMYSSVDLPAQRYWNNTSPAYVSVAQWLDTLTGGDGVFKGAISYSPNQYEYMFEFLGGGAWSTILRAWDFIAPEAIGGGGNAIKLATGEEVSTNDIMFVRRFLGNLTSREDLTTYIKNRDRVMSVKDALKEAVKNGDAERYQEIILQYPNEYKLATKLSAYENQRRKISSAIKKIMDNPKMSDAEKKKRVELLRQQQKDLVNKANLFVNSQ